MANLKEIRTRIASVKSTRQITSAMKMVSAAKLRRAQDAIMQLRPYADKLNEILMNLSADVSLQNNVYAEVRDLNKVLIVVITSNKGLCGGFNSNVIKRSIYLAEEKYKELFKKDKVDFFVIGKRAFDYLRARKYRIIAEENNLLNGLSFDNASPVIERLMKMYINKQYDRIEIVYNQFKNAAVQVLTTEQFLPVAEDKKDKTEHAFTYEYIFEPSREFILVRLIPRSLKIKFYRSLLDSFAAEHGARMTAMHQATDNASQMIQALTLQYNKARQASITKEILEIVSGAEALKTK